MSQKNKEKKIQTQRQSYHAQAASLKRCPTPPAPKRETSLQCESRHSELSIRSCPRYTIRDLTNVHRSDDDGRLLPPHLLQMSLHRPNSTQPSHRRHAPSGRAHVIREGRSCDRLPHGPLMELLESGHGFERAAEQAPDD